LEVRTGKQWALLKALSGERSPSFDTILKVIGALGLKLHAEAGHG
jgi:DNA-binding phage protein